MKLSILKPCVLTILLSALCAPLAMAAETDSEDSSEQSWENHQSWQDWETQRSAQGSGGTAGQAAAEVPGTAPSTTSPSPAAAAPRTQESSDPRSEVINPVASSDLKDRMGDARQKVLSLKEDYYRIFREYSQALRSDGPDSPKAAEYEARVQAVEADLEEARDAIAPLVDEARREGVSEGALRIYRHGLFYNE